MKQLKYINQLQEEKQKLISKKEKLETVISENWHELIKSVGPNNLKEQILHNIFSEKKIKKTILFDILLDFKITLGSLIKNKYDSVSQYCWKWLSNRIKNNLIKNK